MGKTSIVCSPDVSQPFPKVQGGAGGETRYHSIKINPDDGNLLISGHSAAVQVIPSGVKRAFVVRMGSTGAVVWRKSIFDTLQSEAKDVLLNSART